MCLDESADIGFQFRRGPMDTALQLLARQLCKPSFDLIDPGGRCWREVNMPMRAARQPSQNSFSLPHWSRRRAEHNQKKAKWESHK